MEQTHQDGPPKAAGALLPGIRRTTANRTVAVKQPETINLGPAVIYWPRQREPRQKILVPGARIMSINFVHLRGLLNHSSGERKVIGQYSGLAATS